MMQNITLTFSVILFTSYLFGQTSKNPYDFDESQYANNTQKELGLSVLKKLENYHEPEFLGDFIFSKEVFSYALYGYAEKEGADFEEINFEEVVDKVYSSMIAEHKIRVHSIIEKIKSQKVNLADTKIDSTSSKQNINNDITEGSITIYLSDQNDNYRFQISGLNRIKGKWFIAEPRMYWHNSTDIKFINEIEGKSN